MRLLRLAVLLLLVSWLLRLLLSLLRLRTSTAHSSSDGVTNNMTHCRPDSHASYTGANSHIIGVDAL